MHTFALPFRAAPRFRPIHTSPRGLPIPGISLPRAACLLQQCVKPRLVKDLLVREQLTQGGKILLGMFHLS